MTGFDFENGEVLLINKPLRWTSFDVVNNFRAFLKYKLNLPKIKTGHAGTLDPLATGLLILCTGKFTRRIDEFSALQKEYTGNFVLGATTPSFDLEKEIDAVYPVDHITEDEIKQAAQRLTGICEQVPPVFSAKKIAGKRAYEYARREEEVFIKPNQVEIEFFDITRIEMPRVFFRIACSKGTYIRAIARDFGKALNSGAYLESLCRTRIGQFHLHDAWALEELKSNLLQGLAATD